MGGSAISKRRSRYDANREHRNRGGNQLEHNPLLSPPSVPSRGTLPSRHGNLLSIEPATRRSPISRLLRNTVGPDHDHFRDKRLRAARRVGVVTIPQAISRSSRTTTGIR